MTHLGYIVAAYAISALVLLAMTGWIVLDLKAQRRKLDAFEADGMRRRSEVPR